MHWCSMKNVHYSGKKWKKGIGAPLWPWCIGNHLWYSWNTALIGHGTLMLWYWSRHTGPPSMCMRGEITQKDIGALFWCWSFRSPFWCWSINALLWYWSTNAPFYSRYTIVQRVALIAQLCKFTIFKRSVFLHFSLRALILWFGIEASMLQLGLDALWCTTWPYFPFYYRFM